jgi:uncharacterized protein YycO
VRLLFTRNKSTFFNRVATYVISFFTWSRYAHVELLFSDDVCISSVGTVGVLKRMQSSVIRPVSDYVVKEVTTTPEQEVIIRAFAERQVGKPYDWGAIIGLPFRGKWDSDNKWFCSELCAAAFKEAGISLVDENVSRVTPRDILIAI